MADTYDDDSELIVDGPSYFGKPIGFLEPASVQARMEKRRARRNDILPSKRPGHAAPDEQDDTDGRIYGAIHALVALNGDDNLSHI